MQAPGLSNPGIKQFTGGFQDVAQTVYSGFSGGSSGGRQEGRQEGSRAPTVLKILNKPPEGGFLASCKPFSQEERGRLLRTVYSGFPGPRGSVLISSW